MMRIPLQWTIAVTEDEAAMAHKAADVFMETARDRIKKSGHFSVAVSGGSTPRPMHRLLAEDPHDSSRVWEKTHLFWVDERCVPQDDPASNYGMARGDFVEAVAIPERQVHPMKGIVEPDRGATDYEKTLRSFFCAKQDAFPRFDLICLGIGTDGHTASLFPDHPALNETRRWVVAVKGGHPDVWRLTLTLPVLNAARKVMFLVSGGNKRDVVTKVFQNDPSGLPARRIQPGAGAVTWMLDEDAASGLLWTRGIEYDHRDEIPAHRCMRR